MLREDILKMLDIFDQYQIPEERQRTLITNGVRFDFTYGDPDPLRRNKYLDAFQVADLLRMCRKMGIELDANAMLETPWDPKYEKLLEFEQTAESLNGGFQKKI